MSDEEPMVLYDSAAAAVHETRELTGWWSRDGRFWGPDEHMARYMGCTHQKCEICGAPVDTRRGRTVCQSCLAGQLRVRYQMLRRGAWDGGPLCEFGGDRFWFDWNDLVHDVANGDVTPDVMLVIATPDSPPVFDAYELLVDHLPDETTNVPLPIERAMTALNEAIAAEAPLCWRPSDVRPVLTEMRLQELVNAGLESEGKL